MTCIAGIVEKNTVWIGGDSAVSSSYLTDIKSDPKVAIYDDRFIIGTAGSVRVGNLLKYAISIAKPRIEQDTHSYMNVDFIDDLRGLLRRNGCLESESGIDSMDCHALIGYKGKLYSLNSDFGLVEYARGYCAAGSGMDIALGSLHATAKTKMKPKERITKALQAASDLTPYVSPPFTVLSL